MCGIFAYLNYNTEEDRQAIVNRLLKGLRRLEYRGYDSAGLSIDDESGAPRIYKAVGNIDELEKRMSIVEIKDKVRNHIGIAHTRWATHGSVCERNSHPHTSDLLTNEFVVVHNGIITNYDVLKKMLTNKGFTFDSDTDTEVIPKLAKYFYEKDKNASFRKIMEEVLGILEGAYAVIIKSSHFPGECIACKNGSPLILGIKQESSDPEPAVRNVNVRLMSRSESTNFSMEGIEYFLASDTNAIIEHTKNVMFMQDHDLLHFSKGQFRCYTTLKSAQIETERELMQLTMELDEINKGGYAHYMLKEIFEQPTSTTNTMRGRIDFDKMTVKLGGLTSHLEDIRRCRRMIFIACGTSYHSAVATRGVLEELAMTPVTLELASDFLDRTPAIFRDDVCIFISQSGETADTLRALEYCKKRNALCLGITNTVGSSIARSTDCGIYLNCGPEIGVASTKAYTSQIVAILLMALKLGEDSIASTPRRKEIIAALKDLPNLIRKALQLDDKVVEIAKKIQDSKSLLIMGRGNQFATCLEAALKIKELTYMHSEGVLSGELKHGPLALIDENLPILFVATKDKLYDKVKTGFEQVFARGGKPVIMCSEGDQSIPAELTKLEVPIADAAIQPLVNIVPLQLLSYHIAVLRGLNVDQPRHLAKSVTVE